MFNAKKTHKPTTKKQESRPQSSSRSQSCETELQKRAHTPSLENDPHPDKPERKKKKLTSGKSENPKGSSKATPKVVDKIAQEVGEDVVRKFLGGRGQTRMPIPGQKSQKRILTGRRNRKRSTGDKRRKRRKKKNGKKERSKKLRRLSAGLSSNSWKLIKGWPGQNSSIQFSLKSIARSIWNSRPTVEGISPIRSV